METKIITEKLSEAAKLIAAGELVAVPTETVYGLAGNGLDAAAVEKIYEVKGRPEVKPVSLMVPGAAAMTKYCEAVPKQAKYLAEKFWPGPLTIVLRAKDTVPEIVRAGGETVALRCPDHPMTLELLKKAKLPLAAPSANPSGAESPKTARQVMDYFDGKIAAVIDGGPCGIGTESTIIDMSSAPYKILRRGALPEESIRSALADRLTVIGITGGTGCGKTTALQELEAMGALVLDCDAIYHELLESSAELLSEIEKRFPDTVQDGKLNRKALGAVVFADSAALGDLNAITHKYVGLELQRRLREFAMTGGTLAAIDAIELFSSGINGRCFKTVAVISNKENRIKRIMARDGITREYALLRIAAQHDDGYYAERCDYTLYNNADMDSFRNDCRQLFKEMFSNG